MGTSITGPRSREPPSRGLNRGGLDHRLLWSPGEQISSPCSDFCLLAHYSQAISLPPGRLNALLPRPPSSLLLHPTFKCLSSGERRAQLAPLPGATWWGVVRGTGRPHRLLLFSLHSHLPGAHQLRARHTDRQSPGPARGPVRLGCRARVCCASGWGRRGRRRPAHSLVDGLQELALVLPDFGVVDLLEQLCVFVDQPRFPEDVGGRVLDLGKDKEGAPLSGSFPQFHTLWLSCWLIHLPYKDTVLHRSASFTDS